MRWKFYLYDRDGVRTRIEEPGGWESLSITIKRHPERHGTFRELQVNKFEFTDLAMDLLKAEYELYGVQGNYSLSIEGKCGRTWSEEYRGQVSFDTYKFVCADYCYVSVQLDQVGALVDFINRLDQKVDLSSSLAFDGVTALTDYPGLSKTILLPSKAVLLRSSSSNTVAQEYKISDDAGWFPIASTGTMQGGLNIPFANTEVNSIKDYEVSPIIDYFNWSNYQEYMPEIIYNNPEQFLNCLGTSFHIEFRYKGTYKNLVAGSGSHNLTLSLKKGTQSYSVGATSIANWTIHSAGNNNIVSQVFDLTYTGTVTLAPGEKLWLNPFFIYVKLTNYVEDVRIQVDPETYFKVSVISKCDPSNAKLSLINETTSRVIESITNNELKLISDYYGRVDSLPFAVGADGCGSLRAVATGLDIRRAKLADGSDPQMFLSMKDIFDNLNAIDNIGMGPDGVDKIRIENWKYFYQDDVIFTCRGIDSLEKTIKPDDVFSIFKTGYDKWEAEDYNGLDEFLTKREYRTALSQIQNTFEKLSKFIASGYAWEVTRRKTDDTKDWRYDNDTFIGCLSKIKKALGAVGGSVIALGIWTDAYSPGDTIVITENGANNGTYTVTAISHPTPTTTGITVSATLVTQFVAGFAIENLTTPSFDIEIGNVINAANILDPATVYNFRISPERNAMRWFDRVCASYRNITNADKLIFSAGDGNYKAEGELFGAACKPETGVLSESQDISLTTFDDPLDGTPIWNPERVSFRYGVSFTEYSEIKANPYGLVKYISKCEQGFGWIDEIQYFPEEGEAKFLLIPKVNS